MISVVDSIIRSARLECVINIMLLCRESLLVIINGEADIKTCSVGQTYPREIFPGNITDVTVDQEGCNDPF